MYISRRLLLGLFFVVLLGGCRSRDPILIGVSVELSGSGGKIGVAIRNGAQLAVEEINAHGGINGREIELVVLDDHGDPESARAADQELIDLGAVAIVGHVTSQQTEAVYDLVNQSPSLLVSPTTASPVFTGIVDNFFRVSPDNRETGRSLGWAIYDRFEVRSLVCVFEMNNYLYSSTLWDEVKDTFETLGGEVLAEVVFRAGEDDLSEVMAQVAEYEAEAVLFIASDSDTALMAQYGRLIGIRGQYFSSTWALTDELIRKGGSAVEGMVLSAVFDPNNQDPRYLEFAAAYRDRFLVEPQFGASHAYETIMVIVEALRRTGGNVDQLAEAMASISNYEGLQGVISMDPFGDVVRDSYFVMVQDREFVTVEVVSSEEIEAP